jgi:GAF domain-containing protein
MWAKMGEPNYECVAGDAELQQILAQAVEAAGAAEGSLLLINPGGDKLRFVISHSPVSDKLIGTEQDLSEGITGLAVSLQQPMIVNDAASDPRHSQAVDALTTVQTKSIMVVPLASPEAEYGAMTAINSSALGGFSTDDMKAYCEASVKIIGRLVELNFEPEGEGDAGNS